MEGTTCSCSCNLYVTRKVLVNKEDSLSDGYSMMVPHTILLEGLTRLQDENFTWTQHINMHFKGMPIEAVLLGFS